MDQIRQPYNQHITIQGLVIPVDWDQDGNVTAVAISAYDEIEYLVEQTEKAAELLRFVHMQVEARGTLRELEAKGGLIAIEHYRVMKPSGANV
jgi:hypothetical protein